MSAGEVEALSLELQEVQRAGATLMQEKDSIAEQAAQLQEDLSQLTSARASLQYARFSLQRCSLLASQFEGVPDTELLYTSCCRIWQVLCRAAVTSSQVLLR